MHPELWRDPSLLSVRDVFLHSRLPFRIVSIFIRPGKFDRFKPDVLVDNQQSLVDLACRPASFTFQGTPRALSES